MPCPALRCTALLYPAVLAMNLKLVVAQACQCRSRFRPHPRRHFIVSENEALFNKTHVPNRKVWGTAVQANAPCGCARGALSSVDPRYCIGFLRIGFLVFVGFLLNSIVGVAFRLAGGPRSRQMQRTRCPFPRPPDTRHYSQRKVPCLPLLHCSMNLSSEPAPRGRRPRARPRCRKTCRYRHSCWTWQLAGSWLAVGWQLAGSCCCSPFRMPRAAARGAAAERTRKACYARPAQRTHASSLLRYKHLSSSPLAFASLSGLPRDRLASLVA